jgi:hypothetical protein
MAVLSFKKKGNQPGGSASRIEKVCQLRMARGHNVIINNEMGDISVFQDIEEIFDLLGIQGTELGFRIKARLRLSA